MARGLLGFAAGFGKGYLSETQRKEERARQDKIDERNARTAELSQRSSELQIQDTEQKMSDEKTLRDSASTVTAEQGFASGAPGGQIFSADQGQAEQLAQINADAAELEGKPAPASKAVTAATGFTSASKPSIGAPGMNADAMNTPEGRIKRQADALRNMGRVSQATELESKFSTQQTQLYDANRTAIYSKFESTLAGDGVDAALSLYDSYNDGFTVKHVPGANGAGQIIRVGKDGQALGTLSYTSAQDLSSQVRGLIFPDKLREKAAELEDEKRKIQNVKPGEQLIRDGKLVYENNNMTSADAQLQRLLLGGGGGSGGGGSGGGGSGRQEKVPPTTIQQINDAIFASSEKADGAMKLMPDQMLQAQAAGAYLAGRNPGMNPEAIASTAVQLMRNPAAGTPRLGIGGDVVRVLKDATTGQEVSVADFPIDPNSKAGKATLDVLRQEVPKLIDSIERSIPKSEGLLNLAAHGDTVARDRLQELLLQQEIAIIAADPRSKTRTADQNFRIAQAGVAQVSLPALNRQLKAIKAYGEPPPPARPPGAAGSRNASAGQPTRGIFTDTQGRTNLLEPFTRFGEVQQSRFDEATPGYAKAISDIKGLGLNGLRQKLADETNANEEASGIPRRPQ